MNKKKEIKKLALKLLEDAFEAAKKNVDKAIASGAVDTDSFDINSNPMLIPKSIAICLMK